MRALFAAVRPRPLLVVLAGVFAGLSMMLVVAAAVTTTPLVLLAAVPLAITALLLWYQGSGRLAGVFGGRRRRRRHTVTSGGTARDGSRSDDGGTEAGSGNRWRRTVRDEAAHESRRRARRQARGRGRREADGGDGRSTSAGAWRNPRERADRLGGLTRAEAYDVLGLDPSAGEEAVREAYRERAKTAHPDTESGSAESFQELQDAYERLIDG